MTKIMRERLARFREVSAVLRADHAAASELEGDREQAAVKRGAAASGLQRVCAADEVWGHGIHCIDDLFAYLEVALVLTEYETRESQFEAFDGRGCVAIVCLFEALIELRQKKSPLERGFGSV